jgi:hypothetical protein
VVLLHQHRGDPQQQRRQRGRTRGEAADPDEERRTAPDEPEPATDRRGRGGQGRDHPAKRARAGETGDRKRAERKARPRDEARFEAATAPGEDDRSTGMPLGEIGRDDERREQVSPGSATREDDVGISRHIRLDRQFECCDTLRTSPTTANVAISDDPP